MLGYKIHNKLAINTSNKLIKFIRLNDMGFQKYIHFSKCHLGYLELSSVTFQGQNPMDPPGHTQTKLDMKSLPIRERHS